VPHPDLFTAMDLGRRFFPRLAAAIVLIMIFCIGATFQRLLLEAAQCRGARLATLMERAIRLPESPKQLPMPPMTVLEGLALVVIVMSLVGAARAGAQAPAAPAEGSCRPGGQRPSAFVERR